MEKAVYTIGYEGTNPDDFVATLRNAGVGTLIDIRFHPVSRRRGFSKNPLSDILKKNGINYVHLEGLGNPNHNRTLNPDEFEAAFDAHMKTAPAQHDLTRAVETAMKAASCLLCFERNHETCHRNIVADYIASQTGQTIRHLYVYKGGAVQQEMSL